MSCVAITKNLKPCKNDALESSFFCGLHKRNLYNVSEFHLLHSGNIDAILKDKTIKTSEETKKGTLTYPLGKKVRYFPQTFFQLVFPKGFTMDKFEKYGNGDVKTLELNPNIFKYLSKLEKFEAHFVPIGFAYGFCRPEYCATYDNTKSVKENLNMMYHFWILKFIESYKRVGITDLKSLKKGIFSDTEYNGNEFVVNMSIPLEINNKNYIKKIF